MPCRRLYKRKRRKRKQQEEQKFIYILDDSRNGLISFRIEGIYQNAPVLLFLREQTQLKLFPKMPPVDNRNGIEKNYKEMALNWHELKHKSQHFVARIDWVNLGHWIYIGFLFRANPNNPPFGTKEKTINLHSCSKNYREKLENRSNQEIMY